MNREFKDELIDAAGEENVLFDEPMKKHTTFRIGGNADCFVIPKTKEQIQAVVRLCESKKVPYYFLGNGSNLLVSDQGYRGVIINIYKNQNHINIEGNRITAQAGALLSKIAKEALNASLTGFEFAAGIPGTLGGAVVMNAGAYGGEMKQVLVSAKVLSREGEILTLTNEELKLGYRTSVIPGGGYLVLEALLELEPGDKEEIKSRMDDLAARRSSKQPLEFPSAGSTFKRPEGYFAGKLIMDSGLRGYSVGDAAVSEKHCGFVINKGSATAKEVLGLIRHVQEEVFRQFGVKMETEVKMLGDFSEVE